ncbi:hypothetical protein D9758_002614 [Tetrapyrgos nigripes]|uniref:RecF/RecN/SMC N-terminal domain-containing protein n=1 Tax=Tetrapyrgos nigripes TaxID=182062 RepID=A0A8H5LTZ2_9AGAR|nr:hypothetical protein D9758_002614 [Tetrapyrgos nigripes]
MVKRRAHVDSDIEDASPSSKRTRTSESTHDEDGTSGRGANKRSNATSKKGKGKTRQDVSDDEDTDRDEKVLAEEKREKLVRARVEARRNCKQIGAIAKHGVIESIEMHQFMCHRFLSFKFGPQINFIIGHNGSGKSAVLSAITIALGGKSNFTGRGNGLKSFIREGKNVSEITISLKNQGQEAFKPEEYGKSILITRRFTRDGSSTWKIRNHDGKKVISTKRNELAAICDHMNIQVDNPMTVLTQGMSLRRCFPVVVIPISHFRVSDAARQFLSTSRPSEMYQLFLRGTLLSQLSEEYEICLENTQSTQRILEQKRTLLPELNERRKEAQLRLDEAKKALDQKERIHLLRQEMAWALVNSKQEELEGKLVGHEKLLKKLSKFQEDKEKAESQVKEANEEIKNSEEEMEAMGSQDELKQRHADLKEECRGLKVKIMSCKNDLSSIDSQIREIKNTIQDLDEKIAQEIARLATDTQVKRKEHQRQINEATAEVKRYESKRSQIDAHLEDIRQRLTDTECTSTRKNDELTALKNEISDLQAQIQHLDKAEKDRYAPYAPNMLQILTAIEQTRWFGETPVGPLGVFIKVKDARKWADLLSIQLSDLLTSFVVSNLRDRPTLHKLLSKYQYQEKRYFRFQQREPAPGLPTALRAIDVTDPWVLRVLIVRKHIEEMLLSTTRADAETLLDQVGRGVAWSNDGFIVRRFHEGGGSSAPFNRDGGKLRRIFLSGGDNNARKDFLKSKVAELEVRYHPLNDEVQAFRRKSADLKREQTNVANDGRRVDQAFQHAKRHLRQLQTEVDEEVPINIGALEDSKREQEQQKETMLNQGAEVTSKISQQEQVHKEKWDEVTNIKKQLNEYQEVRNGFTSKIDEAVERRLRAQATVEHRDDQLKAQHALVDKKKAEVDNCEEEFKEWTEGATKISPKRIETNRNPENIQKQLDSLALALREREKRQGATVDQLEEELERTTALLLSVRKDWKNLNELNKMLDDALQKRLGRWEEWRAIIAIICKINFQYNLSQRGYYGNAIFKHPAQTLELKVQTDDQNATQGARDKDPKSLSGGEKSFSTVCLLLALWESIHCPLRCLDEFDVFMDAVNRRIAMNMMIDTAKQSYEKQYILITPQDMTNIYIGPTVRVHRMNDPKRGQGALAMG